MVEDRASARYFTEILGTFILTLAVGCNTLTENYVWGATSNACVLMALIFAFADVSGAHFNPAVSIASFISARMSLGELLIYMLCQVLGAALGATTYSLLFLQTFNIAPMLGFSWFQAALAELCYTMMLCLVVLSTAVADRAKESAPEFAPLAIGFVLLAGAHGAGAISGGCFNPAIALAVDVSSAGLGFGWSIAYIGYELMGAALASVFYRLTRPHEFAQNDPVVKESSVSSAQNVRLSMLVSEFLGTFLLTVTVGLNALSGSLCGAWSIGAALMCMIYALGDVSGGHFNPAVTLAVVATGRYEAGIPAPVHGGLYMVAQLFAGIIGAWMFAMMFGWETFSLGPVGPYNWLSRAAVEIFFTFVLCSTVLAVACTTRKVTDEYFGIAIGFSISVGGYVVGMVSGGTMNPAVTFGIATTGFLCDKCMSFLWSFLYIALEFVGGALAAGLFRALRPEEYGAASTDVPSNPKSPLTNASMTTSPGTQHTSLAAKMAPPPSQQPSNFSGPYMA